MINTLGDQVEWFCPSCRRSSTTNKPAQNKMATCDIGQSLAALHSSVAENAAAIKCLLKKKSPVVIEPVKSFRDMVKQKEVVSKSAATQPNTQKDQHLTTVVIKGVDRVWITGPPAQFTRKLSDHFPRVRIMRLSKSAKGVLFLQCCDPEDAERVVKGWNTEFFGSKTTAERFEGSRANKSIIIKHVSTEHTDIELLQLIQVDQPTATAAKRFVKQSKPMHIVQVTFVAIKDAELALKNGIFIGNCYHQAESYIETRLPIRCYNCHSYGHMSTSCTKTQICGHCCSEGHKHDNCDSQLRKCANCNGDHASYDKKCPVFLERVKKMNFLS